MQKKSCNRFPFNVHSRKNENLIAHPLGAVKRYDLLTGMKMPGAKVRCGCNLSCSRGDQVERAVLLSAARGGKVKLFDLV